MEHITLVRAGHGEKSGPKWRGVDLLQNVFGSCAAPTGTKVDEPVQTRKMDTKEYGQMLKTNLDTNRGKGSERLREESEAGLWDIAKRRMLEDRGAVPKEDGDPLGDYQAMHEENFPSSWLREDVEGENEEREELNREVRRRGK